LAYLSIENLYKFVREYPIQWKEEKKVWALSKLHGTSSNLIFEANQPIRFFAGGIKQEPFEALFNKEYLLDIYNRKYFPAKLILYGEAYAGKCMGMSHTYGKDLKYCGFEVRRDHIWLNVPQAEEIIRDFGLDFVFYWRGPNEIEWLDSKRDHPSMQAKKNGILEDRPEEGIVCRAINERMVTSQNRWIFKHKRKEFSEVRTPRIIDDKEFLMMTKAKEVAYEFMTEMRMHHILSKSPEEWNLQRTSEYVKLAIADVKKESEGEVVWSKNIEKSVGGLAVHLFKEYLNKKSLEILQNANA